MVENQLPVPPSDMVMPFANDIYTVVSLVLFAAFMVWTVLQWRKSGSPILLLILIGGAACALQEPLVDHIGAVWYPDINSTFTLFRILNVSIPPWVVPGYGLFVGALSVVLYQKLSAGMTARGLWLFYFVVWVLDLALELPGLNLGTYIYFGKPALMFFGFPMTWAMSNTCIIIISASVLVGFKDYFVGAKLWLVPVVVTMCCGAAQASIEYPTWLALNAGVGPTVKLIAALVTFGMSLIVVHLASSKLTVKHA